MAYKGMDIFANDVVYAREIERRKLLHREWVVATKPTSQTNGVVTLDQRTPESLSPRYSHLRRNPNKIEKQSVWQSRVNHQNSVLLERMIKISNTNSLMPGEPPRMMKDHHEHNERVRRRNMKKVYSENAALSQRLQKIKPTYPNQHWTKEGERQRQALKRLSRDRTLGYLSPERSHQKYPTPTNQGSRRGDATDGRASGSVREKSAAAGLFGYNMSSVEGSHLWEGPSLSGGGSAFVPYSGSQGRVGGSSSLVKNGRGGRGGRSGRGGRRRKGNAGSLRERRQKRERVEQQCQEKEWNTSTSLRDSNDGSYTALFEKAARLFDASYLEAPQSTHNGKSSVRGRKRKQHQSPQHQYQRTRQQPYYPSPLLTGESAGLVREELLFQCRKDSESHVASLTFFERTVRVREAMDETMPGLTIVKSTKANGFRVVAHLAGHASTIDEDEDEEEEEGERKEGEERKTRVVSYQPMMGSSGTAVQQVGQLYLTLVLTALASGSSGDKEVANVARQTLHVLQSSASVSSVKQCLLHHDEEGELLRQFAQLMMLVSDTTPESTREMTTTHGNNHGGGRKIYTVVPAAIVLGKKMCPALHTYAIRIQSMARGMLGRILFFQVLQRTITSEKKLMAKESQRRYRQHKVKQHQTIVLSAIDTLSPSEKQVPSTLEKQALADTASRKTITSPLQHKPKVLMKKKQRPSNQPGRTRTNYANDGTGVHSKFQRPGRQNVVPEQQPQQTQRMVHSPMTGKTQKQIVPRRPSPSKKRKTNDTSDEPTANASVHVPTQNIVATTDSEEAMVEEVRNGGRALFFDNSQGIGSGGSSLTHVLSESKGSTKANGFSNLNTKSHVSNQKPGNNNDDTNAFVAGNITDSIRSAVDGGISREFSEPREESQEPRETITIVQDSVVQELIDLLGDESSEDKNLEVESMLLDELDVLDALDQESQNNSAGATTAAAARATHYGPNGIVRANSGVAAPAFTVSTTTLEKEASLLEELLSLEMEDADKKRKTMRQQPKNKTTRQQPLLVSYPSNTESKFVFDVPANVSANVSADVSADVSANVSDDLSLLEELENMLRDSSGGVAAAAASQLVPTTATETTNATKKTKTTKRKSKTKKVRRKSKTNKKNILRSLNSLERMEKKDLDLLANLPENASLEEEEEILNHLACVEEAVAEAQGETRYEQPIADPSAPLLNKIFGNLAVIDKTEDLHAVSERDQLDIRQAKRERVASQHRLLHGKRQSTGDEEKVERENKIESKTGEENTGLEEHTDESLLDELDSFLLEDGNDERVGATVNNEEPQEELLDQKSLELLKELAGMEEVEGVEGLNVAGTTGSTDSADNGENDVVEGNAKALDFFNDVFDGNVESSVDSVATTDTTETEDSVEADTDTAGIAEGSTQEERRWDNIEGEDISFTKEEFADFYGGLEEWNAATPVLPGELDDDTDDDTEDDDDDDDDDYWDDNEEGDDDGAEEELAELEAMTEEETYDMKRNSINAILSGQSEPENADLVDQGDVDDFLSDLFGDDSDDSPEASVTN